MSMFSNNERRGFEEASLRPQALYRGTIDAENLISVCTRKLEQDPTHMKALFIRASSLLKKGLSKQAI